MCQIEFKCYELNATRLVNVYKRYDVSAIFNDNKLYWQDHYLIQLFGSMYVVYKKNIKAE